MDNFFYIMKFVISILVILFGLVAIIQLSNPKSRLNKWMDTRTYIEQLLYFIFSFTFVVVLVLYLLDYANIPSKLGLVNDDLDAKDYIGYIVELLAAALGAIILIFTTIMQIKNNNEKNEERMNEEKRINNIPVFSYTFEKINSSDDFSSLIKINKLDYFKDIMDYDLYSLRIENVGLNAALKVSISVSNNRKHKCYIGDYDKSCIGKEKSVSVLVVIPKFRENTVVNLNIRYFDLLYNEYTQSLLLSFYPNDLVVRNDRLVQYYECESRNARFIKPNKKEKKLTK